ncbi:MAG: hypothetical protein OCC49_03305 [Fibrobacterales bacterium]
MYQHLFHIPVMGTGHSLDTPIRVAPFGISSVISLVDDKLCEQVRKHYCEEFGLPYEKIGNATVDGRAKRITAYLNVVDDVVAIKFNGIKELPFGEDNEKKKYFDLLPETAPLKIDYIRMLTMSTGNERSALENEITERMVAGSIDVNIMVKLDKSNYDSNGDMLPDEYSDANAALRGYAESKLDSAIIFSAGMNQRLFSYMSTFKDFFRDATGHIKKRVVIKVSDYRSSLIQGKFIARKGIEVSEYRIESGLNCGGHAFASNGYLLPVIMQEFKDNREQLASKVMPMVKKFYKKMDWPFVGEENSPLITVQGGIGTAGENQRLLNEYNMDKVGWASPFLFVPEATPIDDTTRTLLKNGTEKDFYLSPASPLGVPFNNIVGSGSGLWTQSNIDKGTPGSGCPKGFIKFNSEFSEKPICTASKKYQKEKLEQIETGTLTVEEKEKAVSNVHAKQCICHNLGNGALILLGEANEAKAPQSICPGPNAAWFTRDYSLQEMIEHIYGKIDSLVSPERPHMFAKEVTMYVDYFGEQVRDCAHTSEEVRTLVAFKNNLKAGLEYCKEMALNATAYKDENLASISTIIKREEERFDSIYAQFEENVTRFDEKISNIEEKIKKFLTEF